jgi:hypothetical protein
MKSHVNILLLLLSSLACGRASDDEDRLAHRTEATLPDTFARPVSHRLLGSKSDYEVLCDKFKSVYGNCACSSNPNAPLGYISTTAFVACTPPGLVVNANFTTNDRVLSTLNYCNGPSDTCINVTFAANGSATQCSVDYVLPGAQPTACSGCLPCQILDNTTATNDGFIIDCNNVNPSATTAQCTSATTILGFDPLTTRSKGPSLSWSWAAAFAAAGMVFAIR